MNAKILLVLFLIMGMLKCPAQEVVKEPGKKLQTETLINNREFVFNARRVLPSRGSSIDLTTNPGFIKFSPDMIESHMPFFGRAYSGMGYNDPGLHFKGQPEEFKIERKKSNYRITAEVRGENDNFKIFLIVTPNGTGSLSISSNNRESISYSGEIAPPRREN